MGPVLVDSSVWISFFRNQRNEQVSKLDNLLELGGPVCVCPIIIQEVLQGISDPNTFNWVKDLLLRQIILKCNSMESAIESAKIFQVLRRRGVTIRSSADCTIAYHAMFYEAMLLHLDRDFTKIANAIGLKIF
jgi:predicted nucleic acid-binding protein